MFLQRVPFLESQHLLARIQPPRSDRPTKVFRTRPSINCLDSGVTKLVSFCVAIRDLDQTIKWVIPTSKDAQDQPLR